MLLEVIFFLANMYVLFQIWVGNYTFYTHALQQTHASDVFISNFTLES